MKRERINVLVCDDDIMNLGINQKCIELLGKKHEKNLKIYPFQEINDQMEKLIRSREIDIAVLDIELTKSSGIDIAKRLQEYKPQMLILFLTGYEEYKSIACDILALGYLEKPLNLEKFEILFLRAISIVENEKKILKEKFLELTIDKQCIRVRMENIICVEKIQRKVEFRTEKGVYAVWGNLSDYERKLTNGFIKVNQGVIVNREKILSMSSTTIQLINGDEYSIGRTYLKKVREAYNNLIVK